MKRLAKLIIATITIVVLTGCVSIGKFPVEPQWKELSVPPVVQQFTNGNYEITGELMELSTQQKYWLEKVMEWRDLNQMD